MGPWGSLNPIKFEKHHISSVLAPRGYFLFCFYWLQIGTCQEHCQRLNNGHLWLREQRICLQLRRPGFNPWVRKIPWRRKWQPIPVPLPGKFYGQRSQVVYSPWGGKGSDMADWLAFIHSFCGDWTLCCCSYWPSTPPREFWVEWGTLVESGGTGL